MPWNSKTAAEAGRKSVKGKHKKTLQWEALSEKFTGAFADKVINYLETLSDDDMGKFMDHYKDLLNYFKPKMQSVQNKNEGTLKIIIDDADNNKKD